VGPEVKYGDFWNWRCGVARAAVAGPHLATWRRRYRGSIRVTQGEAGVARLSAGQLALHQALCLFCWAALPAGNDQGDLAKELALDSHAVKAPEIQSMEAQLSRAGMRPPQVIGSTRSAGATATASW
jgi:hypothetical protein